MSEVATQGPSVESPRQKEGAAEEGAALEPGTAATRQRRLRQPRRVELLLAAQRFGRFELLCLLQMLRGFLGCHVVSPSV